MAVRQARWARKTLLGKSPFLGTQPGLNEVTSEPTAKEVCCAIVKANKSTKLLETSITSKRNTKAADIKISGYNHRRKF